jgi:hypothetical protein
MLTIQQLVVLAAGGLAVVVLGEEVMVVLVADQSNQSQRVPTLPTLAIDTYEKQESMQIGCMS